MSATGTMLSRSKSAQGLRVLGSNVGSTGHQDTEIEYTFIKGLVEAYSQQCMPPSYNKIPLRADKWTPVRETGPRYRLDLSSISLTPRWATSSFSRIQDARAKDGRDGYRRSIKGYGTSGIREPRPKMSRSRPTSPVRNTFQRSGTTVEEKVLPVWTPELKEGIVFSHRYPSTSSLSKTNTPRDENGNVVLKQSSGDNRCPSRRESPSRIPSLKSNIHRPLTKKREQIRPKTVSAIHRPSLKPKEKAIDDTDIMPCPTDEFSKGNEKAIEGLTKMTEDQQTQTLSLDVFLPREVDGASVTYHEIQVHPLADTIEEPSKGKEETGLERFPSRNELFSHESKMPKHSNDDMNQEHYDNVAASQNDNMPSSRGCCPRYQNTISKLCGAHTTSNCKKWIHCELFGPVLCSDCRLEREKSYKNSSLELEDDFSMPALSLRGRKPVLSPRN